MIIDKLKHTELKITDDYGQVAILETEGFSDDEILRLLMEHDQKERKVNIFSLHEHVRSKCDSNQKYAHLIFK